MKNHSDPNYSDLSHLHRRQTLGSIISGLVLCVVIAGIGGAAIMLNSPIIGGFFVLAGTLSAASLLGDLFNYFAHNDFAENSTTEPFQDECPECRCVSWENLHNGNLRCLHCGEVYAVDCVSPTDEFILEQARKFGMHDIFTPQLYAFVRHMISVCSCAQMKPNNQ